MPRFSMPVIAARALALALAVALGGLVAIGCDASAEESRGPGITVVATTTQLQDFARNVAGSRAEVVGLLDPAVDPHDYEPRPSDVDAVARAQVVVKNGLRLDDWVDRIVESAGGEATVVTATAGIEPASSGDPHVWHDPRNAVRMVRTIADALAIADPPSAPIYRTNARRYVARIEALDRELERRVARVPGERRKLVTDHDAFGYLARRYGITVVGAILPSLSTAAEPSARSVVELASTIRRQGVRVIFSETSLDPRLAREIADEAGARVDDGLYGDTLGPAGSPGATYIGMMRHNVARMVVGFTAR